MLIERIHEIYREFIEPVVTSDTITTIPESRPAVNARHFDHDAMQARRQRRQRRLNRASGHNIHGWTVRTW